MSHRHPWPPPRASGRADERDLAVNIGSDPGNELRGCCRGCRQAKFDIEYPVSVVDPRDVDASKLDDLGKQA